MHTVTDYASSHTDIAQKHTGHSVLALLAEKLGDKRFDLWFGQDTLCSYQTEQSQTTQPQTEGQTTESKQNDGVEKVVFTVRNQFKANGIRRHCKQEIDQTVLELFGKALPIEFTINTPQQILPFTGLPSDARLPDNPKNGGNPQDTDSTETKTKEQSGRRFASMTTFLEGLSNRLACRAADLAINHPGEINPIYIFGPTSTGKTHILEGIWSAVRKKTSRLSSRQLPMYLTAEQFLSSFVETIRNGASRDRNQNFRSKFKGISHLLIDDIQLFARADSTQTEFLHVFDMLRNLGIQLVFSGDRPLKELPLRSELIGRLEAGMICEINLPERELSLRICQNLVQQRELPIEHDVCRLIASRFGVHARQILGALNRLHMHYLVDNQPITLTVAEEVLGDLLRLNRRDIRLPDIGKAVCKSFGLAEDTLRSKSRLKQIATPRMLAMWLARKYTRSALSEIGLYFGNLSHSSVIAAQRKIDRQIGEDKSLAEIVQELERTLG